MSRQDKTTEMKVKFFQALLNAGFTDITRKFHSDYDYSEEELDDYESIIKRAFIKGTYTINCDYGEAWIKVGEHNTKIGFDHISDKLITLVIYLASLKNESSRHKFGYYVYKVADINDVYDSIMNSYPYTNSNKTCKHSIEEARSELPKILQEVIIPQNRIKI